MALKELAAAYECLGADYQPGQRFESGHISCCSQGIVVVRLNIRRYIQILDVRIHGIECCSHMLMLF